jgi:hypothetical protein
LFRLEIARPVRMAGTRFRPPPGGARAHRRDRARRRSADWPGASCGVPCMMATPSRSVASPVTPGCLGHSTSSRRSPVRSSILPTTRSFGSIDRRHVGAPGGPSAGRARAGLATGADRVGGVGEGRILAHWVHRQLNPCLTLSRARRRAPNERCASPPPPRLQMAVRSRIHSIIAEVYQ